MPQLDFFTFPHQYVIASICFCGVYYFNLLFFFPKIKYFQLNKIFSINALAANVSVIQGDYLNILSSLFHEENFIYSNFENRIKKLTKNFFLKNLTATHISIKNSHNLLIHLLITFLVLFFFLKNFLIFNAEKLMLIYFLLVSITIFFFSKNYLKILLENDLKQLLVIAVDIELEGDKILIILKNAFFTLKQNLINNYIEFLVFKNLQLKFIKF